MMRTDKYLIEEIKNKSQSICIDLFDKNYYKAVNKLINELNKNKTFSMNKGSTLGWVAGLIYVVGVDSNLFDKNNFYKGKIYISKKELSKYLGVSLNTMKSREKYIREAVSLNSKFIASIKDEFSFFNSDGSFNQKAMDRNINNIMTLIKNPKKEDYEVYREKALKTKCYKEAIHYTKLSLDAVKRYFNCDGKNSLQDFKPKNICIIIKKDLADLYMIGKEYEKAYKEYEELLNLGVKNKSEILHKILICFLRLEMSEEIEMLLNNYKEESTFLLYSKALYYFSQNQIFNAKLNLKKALNKNSYVPKYLIGINTMSELPKEYKYDSKEEAMIYFDETIDIWLSIENSLVWLTNNYFEYIKKNNIDIVFSKNEALTKVHEAIDSVKEDDLFEI
ncbi:Uncharacterised protein [[Clostridium] sordellii]|nr:Uncharacterised protein [[Clostridium] sordellii] [Paeniclostridium sordellii]CEN30808.1 Uncharacterised protein [[Clostridium] sordellii] [Paeniclostridium sordellii]